jgi:2,5-diketo-D-gluconate reductase B
VLARVGKAHGKTAAQVCLRWLVQQQVAVIPRTSRVERLSENFSVLDFELSSAEMADIGALAHPDGRLIDYAYSGTPKWD